MESGLKGKVLRRNVDPCAKCGKKVIENSVMCTKCGKWMHARCMKMKRVTTTLAKDSVCERCVKTIKEPDKKISFFDQIEL